MDGSPSFPRCLARCRGTQNVVNSPEELARVPIPPHFSMSLTFVFLYVYPLVRVASIQSVYHPRELTNPGFGPLSVSTFFSKFFCFSASFFSEGGSFFILYAAEFRPPVYFPNRGPSLQSLLWSPEMSFSRVVVKPALSHLWLRHPLYWFSLFADFFIKPRFALRRPWTFFPPFRPSLSLRHPPLAICGVYGAVFICSLVRVVLLSNETAFLSPPGALPERRLCSQVAGRGPFTRFSYF